MAKVTTKGRVLVCDDNRKNYEKLKKYLESEGFNCPERISTEAELRQVLSAAEHDRDWYQFVMLDMDLSLSDVPKATGLSVYNSVLPDFPNETYIIYSSHDADEFRAEINRLMYRDVKFVLLDQLLKDRNIRLHLSALISNSNHRRIFLVHGRNHKLRDKVHRLLTEGFGLEVVGWEDARERIRTERSYIYEIVMSGIEMSHLTLVLFSDDEQIVLRNKFKSGQEKVDKRERRQARANVFIEAGYAMGVRPRRTLFLEWPENTKVHFETPSDFAGIHSIRFDESASKREVLRRRLESARCLLTVKADWETMPL